MIVGDPDRESWLMFLFLMFVLFALIVAYAWQRALQ